MRCPDHNLWKSPAKGRRRGQGYLVAIALRGCGQKLRRV
jgi:hypothetical protein